MNESIFFRYYLPALKQALSEDNIEDCFFIKSPNWYYPIDGNKELYTQLDNFETESYYDYIILEIAGCYFDAKSHGFDSIEGIPMDMYREDLVQEMKEVAANFNIDLK